MLGVLEEINAYDLRLWVYAQTLLSDRIAHMHSIVAAAVGTGTAISPERKWECVGGRHVLSPVLKGDIGIFQPPGHKGPLG